MSVCLFGLLLGQLLAQNTTENNSQENIFEQEKNEALDTQAETSTDFNDYIDGDNPPGAGFRALAVFGTAALIAIVYFYFKLKRVRDRERIHYSWWEIKIQNFS